MHSTIRNTTCAKQAIILARVSSKEQEEGYSIDAQKFRLQEYCTRRNLNILKIFEFCESSTTGNRKKFKEAIDFAKKQKNITAIVSDKVDRLQRSYKETPLLNDLVDKEKIELHFYTENCIIHKNSTSHERMIWNMFVMMAQSYVDSLKDNVNRSIDQKLRMGEWVSGAPIGYLHKPKISKNTKGTIEIDPDRAPLIKKIFEYYATGNFTLPELLKETKKWGLKKPRGNKSYLSRAYIHELIQNPFYYGVMRIKKTGKEYPHIYPPIISKELFDRCKAVRLGYSKKPFKYGKKEYLLRGLITCATTNHVVTADTKSKVNKQGKMHEWTYLIVRNPEYPEKKMYIREEEVIEQIEKVFSKIKLDEDLLIEVMEYIKSCSKCEKEFHNRRIGELNAQITKTRDRINTLTDLYLDGDFDKKSFEEKREELMQNRNDLTLEIQKHDRADDNFTKPLSRLVELAFRALDVFKGSNIEEKRKLLSFVFSNLKLRGRKLEFKLHPPFDDFVKLSKSEEWLPGLDSNQRPNG